MTDAEVLGGELAELGGMGARFAARFLPTKKYSEKCQLSLPADAVSKLAIHLISSQGRLFPGSSSIALRAIFQRGISNPAVVYVKIRTTTPETCEVEVTAAAKEGLIPQRTAANTVKHFLSLLQSAAGAS